MKMGKLFNWLKGNREEERAERTQEDRAQKELDELIKQYGDGNTLDPEEALRYLLHVALHGVFETKDAAEGDHLLLPEWNATLTPAISQLTERGVVLDFYLYAPQWGRELYECCAGMGDSPKQAQGMAVGSFAFTFMQGIAAMERRENGQALTTSFAGHDHRWQVYRSNIVGLGKMIQPKETHPRVYWDALKDGIVKRLGNQKLCYVKIYGAKVGDNVTGECRIDDVKSDELSAKVAELVSQWEVEGFASQKQFFFIRQEEDTVLPNAYEGKEGQRVLNGKVIRAVQMFHASWGKDDFDSLESRMARELGDPTLAAECMRFMPEICAEHAYEEHVTFGESVMLAGAGKLALDNTVYKNQLADYYPISQALLGALQAGVFGEETNTIYRELIGYSATYGSIAKAQEQGSSLEGGKLSALLFRVGEDFEIR